MMVKRRPPMLASTSVSAPIGSTTSTSAGMPPEANDRCSGRMP
jgi:hypothetical protein